MADLFVLDIAVGFVTNSLTLSGKGFILGNKVGEGKSAMKKHIIVYM